MIYKTLIDKLSKLILRISDNAILIHFLVSTFGLLMLILSINTIAATFITFKSFVYVLLVSLIISIILTIFNLKFNSLIKKLWLIKPFETFLYFTVIILIFFKINFYVSFKTDLIYDDYNVYKSKITHNIIGQKNYKFWVTEDSWHDWASSAWIYVDSTKFYDTRDYISIKIKKGIFGFKIIPKNQIK
jgi:hypothetical protein